MGVAKAKKTNTTGHEPFRVNRFRRLTEVKRSGEDTTLTDRIHAAAATDQDLDEEAAEIFEVLEFKQRQSKREELKSAMKEVKELVDDDLEF